MVVGPAYEREPWLMGRALKALRNRAVPRLTQEGAAEAAGVTLTAWQNYEGGKRRFTPALIAMVTLAVGATAEDLVEEYERVKRGDAASAGVAEPAHRFEFPLRGRVQAGPKGVEVFDTGEEGVLDISDRLGRGVRFMRVAGESMIPYAEPGGWVSYDVNGYPRRGNGCVVIMADGRAFIKRFERTVGAKLYVTELYPEEREISFDMSEVRGVYPVGLRSD